MAKYVASSVNPTINSRVEDAVASAPKGMLGTLDNTTLPVGPRASDRELKLVTIRMTYGERRREHLTGAVFSTKSENRHNVFEGHSLRGVLRSVCNLQTVLGFSPRRIHRAMIGRRSLPPPGLAPN